MMGVPHVLLNKLSSSYLKDHAVGKCSGVGNIHDILRENISLLRVFILNATIDIFPFYHLECHKSNSKATDFFSSV